jgi:hypothetical protein
MHMPAGDETPTREQLEPVPFTSKQLYEVIRKGLKKSRGEGRHPSLWVALLFLNK